MLFRSSGNVSVTVDGAHSSGETTSFEIDFKGAKAATDVALLGVNASGLDGVNASMHHLIDGVSKVAEEQNLIIGSHSQSVGYTLSLEYGGKTYTSGNIAANATQAQVQSAINAGFGSISGAQVQVTQWTGQGEYNLSFGGSLSGKDVDLVQIKPNVEPSTASVTGTGNFVVGNTAQNKLRSEEHTSELQSH